MASEASSVLKAWEECDKTDTLFILVCTVFCWTIVPTVSRRAPYPDPTWAINIATCSPRTPNP